MSFQLDTPSRNISLNPHNSIRRTSYPQERMTHLANLDTDIISNNQNAQITPYIVTHSQCHPSTDLNSFHRFLCIQTTIQTIPSKTPYAMQCQSQYVQDTPNPNQVRQYPQSNSTSPPRLRNPAIEINSQPSSSPQPSTPHPSPAPHSHRSPPPHQSSSQSPPPSPAATSHTDPQTPLSSDSSRSSD
jgi:hypothetical protein